MSIDSVSSYSLYQSTLRDAGKVMADLARNQTQTSSGLKSQSFAGMANDAAQYLSLDSKMTRTQQYINNNLIVSTRLDSTSSLLTNVIQTAREISKNIQLRIQPAGLESGFSELITGNWQTITDQLNTSINGRYLLGGTKTDTQPVDTETFPTLSASGGLSDAYYKGSQQNLTFRPQDNVEMTYSVRADDPAIQKIMAGLAMAKAADASGNGISTSDDQLNTMNAANALVQEGLSDLTSVKARIDANVVTLSNISDRQTAEQTYWKGIKENLVNTDLVAVSTEVAVNQGILTAAFQVFAKINSLRLSDFLR